MSEIHTIDIVLSPELLEVYRPTTPTTFIVVDILRATSTIVAAFDNGVRCIYPLETIEEAKAEVALGHLVGAERHCVRCDFARLGNDPLEYTAEVVRGQEIYFTTTNGTRTLKKCMSFGPEHTVLAGAFTNIGAVADYCRDRNVLVVCAGWEGHVCLEDALFGAALADRLSDSHLPGSDAVRMVLDCYRLHASDLEGAIRASDHYRRLLRVGKADALTYCLNTDTSRALPLATTDSEGRLLLRND